MSAATKDHKARPNVLSDAGEQRPFLQLEAPSPSYYPEPVEVTWEDEQDAIRVVEIQL